MKILNEKQGIDYIREQPTSELLKIIHSIRVHEACGAKRLDGDTCFEDALEVLTERNVNVSYDIDQINNEAEIMKRKIARIRRAIDIQKNNV